MSKSHPRSPAPTTPPSVDQRPKFSVPPVLMAELEKALMESQRATTALSVFSEAHGLDGYYRLVFAGAQLVPVEAPKG